MPVSDLLASGFDVLLCIGLLWLAWQAITGTGLFRSVVMFMVFGLMMAVTWARLGSPDLALAEAAIGAGITGALLLNACRAAVSEMRSDEQPLRDRPSGVPKWLALPLSLAAGVGLAWLMHSIPRDGGPTPEAAIKAAETHFLDNPITSVLLDFRAIDTLLEMAVLLLALVGARVLLDQRRLPALYPVPDHPMPMLPSLLAMITPVLLLTGLYLFWAGSHAPGGAFQAGALLGALGVMYQLAGRFTPTHEPGTVNALLITVGLGLFSLFACLSLLWAPAPLSHPEQGAYALVLLIEFALMLSIAATLVLLFVGSRSLQLRRSTNHPGGRQ